MRILIFNWKDMTHPMAGGAELATHQYARHLVSRGHQVTIFTSLANSQSTTQTIDGVQIFRHGNWYTVYFWAVLTYLTKFRFSTDIVIDQIHGLPFFTPLFVRKPILTWIHEIAGVIWFKEYPWPIAVIGNWFEQYIFKLYKHTFFLTDSLSTKKELNNCGLNEKQMTVIPLTINKPPLIKTVKSQSPLLIYLGRLSPMKQIDWLIKSLSLIKVQIPNIKLYLLGSGKTKYEKKLRQLINKLNLTDNIDIKGKVTESHKFKWLAKAWLHIHPSIKEGFGLTVLEAASQKTPTIGFNVPGLKDIIKNGVNGQIVPNQTPQSLAENILDLISRPKLLKQLQENACRWSKTLPTWEEQTKKLEELLLKIETAYSW